MSILKHVPKGFKARPEQILILEQVEKNIELNDVIVLPADVASGKSLILQTIARYLSSKGLSVATLTPRVALQQQYKESFKDIAVLKGKARYSCGDSQFKSCQERYDIMGDNCKGCHFTKEKKRAETENTAVFNIHSYGYLKNRKQVLQVDEAHLLFDVLSDVSSRMIWQHKTKYPDNLNHYLDVIVWLEKDIKRLDKEIVAQTHETKSLEVSYKSEGKVPKAVIAARRELAELERDRKLGERVLNGIKAAPSNFFIEHVWDEYRGKKRKALKIRPTTMKGLPAWLWPPDKTKKIILASGTINKQDVEMLGLGDRRVKFIDCPPAIPAVNRPIILDFAGNMSYKYQDKNMPALAAKIMDLKGSNKGTKGFVHVTYSMALKLKKLLSGSDFVWHTKEDKEDKLKEWMESPNKNSVFIASGMAEGVDLAGPEFGWQAICKIQYPSRGDKLVEFWYNNNQEWISWLTARTLMQQCGRICRGPDDFGKTYILDASHGNQFKRRFGFYQRSKKYLPDFFTARYKR